MLILAYCMIAVPCTALATYFAVEHVKRRNAEERAYTRTSLEWLYEISGEYEAVGAGECSSSPDWPE